ncbi:long-chain fatty acid--CoA ligase [Streptomyces sp. NA02950]|uniref:long-chain-fatty-acid--CoA ligase n=1 Tax=Streptomyces sp. NA02950 TaxID=2742137 RepID=UPI0015907526|nr:long-chain fatty acid--CoA ligase [Streptomyces sp. NA02950]QKV96239.1 long-chain fatty acid--CoA ligase [Streptomyces sp. NA02950]
MTALSLAATLADPARRSPGSLALVEGGVRLTYGELWTDALSYAAALREQGVRPDDRVALLCPNTADFVRAYYAILAVGGVVVPVPTLLTADEAAHILEHSCARTLIAEVSHLDLGRTAAQQAGISFLPLGDGHHSGSLNALAPSVDPLRTYTTRDTDDPAVIFYTSGTTGRPKGAILTHFNLVMNATVNAFDVNRLRPDDVALGCLPLFHTFGQTVAMNATFRAAATLVLQPRFDPDGAITLMREEGVTAFYGVPTMFIRLLDSAEGRPELPRLGMCVSGGASLPVTVLERFEQTFTTTVYEGYGLSETSPTASVNQPGYGRRPGTVGHPLWGVDVEIADAGNEDCIELLPHGETGEVVIRGHNVMAGYLGDPEATDAALVDGWFRTGDIGRKDADGFLSIVDRKKDLIIRGGFNVYPREVEEALARHPDIAEAAVIGIPDSERGEEICAVVVPRSGHRVDPDALLAWTRDRLGRHKYPRRVEVVDSLPLGPSHKVLKRELRRRFTQQATPRATERTVTP